MPTRCLGAKGPEYNIPGELGNQSEDGQLPGGPSGDEALMKTDGVCWGCQRCQCTLVPDRGPGLRGGAEDAFDLKELGRIHLASCCRRRSLADKEQVTHRAAGTRVG